MTGKYNVSLCLNYMQTPPICQENLLLQWFTVKFKRGNYGSACGCVGSYRRPPTRGSELVVRWGQWQKYVVQPVCEPNRGEEQSYRHTQSSSETKCLKKTKQKTHNNNNKTQQPLFVTFILKIFFYLFIKIIFWFPHRFLLTSFISGELLSCCDPLTN